MVKMTKQEKEWQAQSDLQTLKTAGEITANKQRLAAARKEGEKQIKAVKKAVKRGRK